MSLFFKHLFVSIKRKPLQPIILVLTLTLSIFVILSALCLKDALTKEAQLSKEAQYGSADITISLNSQSKARFMFTSYVRELLENRGKVAGVYDIVLSKPENGDAIFATAADFYEINNIFNISFTSYGAINDHSLASSALISESFAQKNSLKVGDVVDFVLFGQNVSYTVQGISPTMYLGKYDVMVDIRGVIKALSEKSIFVSALGEDFKPSSTIYIDVNEGYDIIECTSYLKSSPDLNDKSFINVNDLLSSQSNTAVLNVVIDICVVLICLLGMAVTYCCFYILANERHEENYAFLVAGAKKSQLNLLQYLEVFIYWLFSVILGAGLCYMGIGLISRLVGLRYCVAELSPLNLLTTISMVLVSALLTVSVFIFTPKKKAKRTQGVSIYALVALTILAIIGLFALPISVSKITGTLITVFILLLVFVVCPIIIRLITGAISKRIDKRGKCSPCLKYAFKNLHSLRTLHNVARLISVLVGIILLSVISISAAHSNVAVANNLFNTEYAIVGATNSCYEKISAREEISSVEKAFVSTTVLEHDISVTLLSASDKNLLSDAFLVRADIKNNEAIISKVVAKTQGVGIGDTLKFNCDNKELELVVKDVVSSPMCFILFDCENVGIGNNLLLPIKNNGVSENEALLAISQEIAEDVAQTVKVSTLMQEKTKTMDVYLKCGDILIVLIILFALIGLVNSLHNCYYARKQEFTLFNISGMSKKEIQLLKSFEIILALLLGLIVGILGTLVILPFMQYAMILSGTEVLIAFFYGL